jgi:hypothetical protein
VTAPATGQTAVGVSDDDTLTVVALTNCKIFGVERQARERFQIPRDREHALVGTGLLESDESFARLWRRPRGRILTPDEVPTVQRAGALGDRPLRVLQMTHYDPGCAAYRYHSALNTQPGVSSVFVRFGHNNPACDLRQYDGMEHLPLVMSLVISADVIICHMDFKTLFHAIREVPTAQQVLVRHYHGSCVPLELGGDPAKRTYVEHEVDGPVNALQVGARPYHHRWGVAHWWGIPMPVADYAGLAEARLPRVVHGVARPYRVAHSPTVRAWKGTAEFLDAVSALRAEGVNIEPVLIEGMSHGAALRLKASCDATFDSFWLGMQGSGLEMAAMGGVCVAGDAEAVADLRAYGEGEVQGGAVTRCPWTFAGDGAALKETLRRLATDPVYHAQEAARVAGYVARWHSYEAVGARMLATLQGERARRGLTGQGVA